MARGGGSKLVPILWCMDCGQRIRFGHPYTVVLLVSGATGTVHKKCPDGR